MSNKRLLITAIALLAVGVVGLCLTWVLLNNPTSPLWSATFSSNGERIYHTGASSDGPIARTQGGGMMGGGMMAGIACVDCHGEDGRGGDLRMMRGDVEIPDIRYSALTSPHEEHGETESGWSDADIARAIRDGVEPDGQRLKAPMPRWDMTDSELEDLIDYLKELDSR